ncbi:MAG: geranylgeranylglycerol-phosphate geranylgeranyltransferase [Candidatus Bathyarchaeia archaeon]
MDGGGTDRSHGLERLKAFLRIIRPINCLMTGLAVLVGTLIALAIPGPEGVNHRLPLGFSTGFLLTGASMAVNDYYDRHIDAINEPDRPIPSGLVKPWEALALTVVLAALGLLAAHSTSPECFMIALASLAISLLYSTKGKRTGLIGNLMVSACVAIPFLYGGFVAGRGLEPLLVIFASMAFLSNAGREVTKGIADAEGDRARGIRTVAVAKGNRTAAELALALFSLAVALSAIPPFSGLVSAWYIPPVVVADLGFLRSSLRVLRNPSRPEALKAKGSALLWMALGMAAFLAGSLIR